MPPLPPVLAELIADATATPVLEGEAGATVLRLTAAHAPVRYLKYGTGRVADDIADEAARLSWLGGRMPCAEVVLFVRTNTAAWLLTTEVAGRTGDGWLAEEPERLNQVIDGFAGFLRGLHALPVADCPFDAGAPVRMAAARRNLDADLVDTDDFDDEHDGWTGEEVWAKLAGLVPADGERVVTHGDFSLGNLLLDDSGRVTGAIDVGRLGTADRYQDIAIFWQNLAEFGAEAQHRFLRGYGVATPDERRLAFHRTLDELF